MTVPWVDFREIKRRVTMDEALRMYEVRLRVSGIGVLRGACPLPMHESGDGQSFSVDVRRNVWACHSQSCIASRGGRIGGNVLDFVALMACCSIREAALLLRDRFRPSAQRTSNFLPAGPVSNRPLSFALSNVQPCHPYLLARDIDHDTATRFGVGFYTGPGLLAGRIVIPIHDEAGQLIAYAGRSVGNGTEPKYRFPAGFCKSAALFNLHQARSGNHEALIVVEGFFDCMRVHQAGFQRVVALMGCSMSNWQAERVRGICSRAILLFDGDSAGMTGADATARRLDASGVVTSVITLPNGSQPDSLSLAELHTLVRRDRPV